MSKEARASKAYCCPLCLTRKNEEFYDSPLMADSICETCFIQFDHLFSGDDERPEACIVDRVEQFTGLTWNECLVIVLRENLDYWQNMERDRDAFRDKFGILSEMLNWTESRAREHIRGMTGYYETRLAEAAKSAAQTICREFSGKRDRNGICAL